MPPSSNYVWSITEYNALMDRIASLEQDRDFLGLRGAYAYVANDGSGGSLPNGGGKVDLVASTAYSYSLAAPASEIAELDLTNASAVTHTVSVSGGSGFTSLTLAPGERKIIASASDSLWHR